ARHCERDLQRHHDTVHRRGDRRGLLRPSHSRRSVRCAADAATARRPVRATSAASPSRAAGFRSVTAPHPAQVVDPERAREHARDILGDRRFRHDAAPRPFRGPLRWLGDRLRPIGRALGKIADLLPWYVWLALAIAVTVAVIARIVVVSRRRYVTGLS